MVQLFSKRVCNKWSRDWTLSVRSNYYIPAALTAVTGRECFFSFFLSFFSSLISFRPSIHLFGRIKATNTFKRPWDKNSAMESAMAKKKKVFLVDWWPTLEQQRNALIRCSTHRRREMVVASSRRFSSKKLLPVPHQQSPTAAQATKWWNNKPNVILEMNLIH